MRAVWGQRVVNKAGILQHYLACACCKPLKALYEDLPLKKLEEAPTKR